MSEPPMLPQPPETTTISNTQQQLSPQRVVMMHGAYAEAPGGTLHRRDDIRFSLVGAKSPGEISSNTTASRLDVIAQEEEGFTIQTTINNQRTNNNNNNNNNNHNDDVCLAEATPIEDDDEFPSTVEAWPFDVRNAKKKKLQHAKQQRRSFLVIVMAMVFVSIVVGVILGVVRRRFHNHNNNLSFIKELSQHTLVSLDGFGTPQWKALKWPMHHPNIYIDADQRRQVASNSDSVVADDFVCPKGFPKPLVHDPGDDVTRVHPAHIRYVAALGDSITAGFASEKALPMEFRGDSFAGVGRDSHHTLQWFLQHYQRAVTGGSMGIHKPQTVSSKDPYRFSRHDHLNVAVSSSESRHWAMQISRLKSQMQSLPDDGGWMVITIFLGENDICTHIESCGTTEMQQKVVDNFESNMESLLSALVAWRKRLYINLFQLFWLSSLAKLQATSLRCEIFENEIHVCPCMHEGTDNLEKIDTVSDRINRVLENLADRYDRVRSDIGVNVVRTFDRVPVPDLSYLSELDCFHPSQKTHRFTAQALWNSMLHPSRPTPMSDGTAFVPLCANETSHLVTWRDRNINSTQTTVMKNLVMETLQ